MITLKNFASVVPFTIIDLSEEHYIQVLDNVTCAHFRKKEDGSVTLGGDFYCENMETLLGKEIEVIEFPDDKIEIYLRS